MKSLSSAIRRIGHVAWWGYVRWAYPLADRLAVRWGGPARMVRWPIPGLAPVHRRRIQAARPGALGDIVMCTAAFRELKRRNPDCHVTFYTHYRDVAEGCPYIDEVRPIAEAPRDVLWLDYEPSTRRGRRLHRHLVQLLGDQLGVDVRDVTPACPVDPEEVERFRAAWADLPRPRVVVVRKSGANTPNKDWPDEHWEELLDRLLPRCTIIEVGARAGDRRPRPEPNYVDLVGRTTLPQLMAALAAADLQVAPITGTVHVAAAVGLPSVVIYGGYEHPGSTAYPGNINLYSPVECAPCWLATPCPIGKKCLHLITPEQVDSAVDRLWRGRPISGPGRADRAPAARPSGAARGG